MERKVGFSKYHVMSAFRIPQSRSNFPFMDNRDFSANRPPRNARPDGHNVKRHAACPAAKGDIEGRSDSWEDAARGIEPKARVLCQDRVRETTRSMSGSSLKLDRHLKRGGTPDVRTVLVYRRNNQALSFSSTLDGIPMCRNRPMRPNTRSKTRWRPEVTGSCRY